MPGAVPVAPRRRRANNTGDGITSRIAGLSTGAKVKLAIAAVGIPFVMVLVLLVAVVALAQSSSFAGFFSGGTNPPPDLPDNTDGGIQRAFMLPNTGKVAIFVRTATPTLAPATAVPTAKPTVRPTRRAVQPQAPKPKTKDTPDPTATPGVAQVQAVRAPLPPRIWDSRLGPGGLPLLTGVGVTDAPVQSGQTYWRLVKMVFQDAGAESGNDHTIYISIIDENRQRLDDQTVVISWDESGSVQVERLGIADEKPKGDYCNCNYNWPMYGAGYRVKVDGSLPSDEVYGMIMPEHRHVNYLITFQRVVMP